MINALDNTNSLEPVEYNQTQYVTEEYTSDTSQSHKCGGIAQSVQRIDNFDYDVFGGAVGDDGEEAIRHLRGHAILTHAVKASHELSEVIKQ